MQLFFSSPVQSFFNGVAPKELYPEKDNGLSCGCHVKAAPYDQGASFITTVKPKDLPECWGVRFQAISLPGCNVDLEAIKEELENTGIPKRRGYFTLAGSNKATQQRSTLAPKY